MQQCQGSMEGVGYGMLCFTKNVVVVIDLWSGAFSLCTTQLLRFTLHGCLQTVLGALQDYFVEFGDHTLPLWMNLGRASPSMFQNTINMDLTMGCHVFFSQGDKDVCFVSRSYLYVLHSSQVINENKQSGSFLACSWRAVQNSMWLSLCSFSGDGVQVCWHPSHLKNHQLRVLGHVPTDILAYSATSLIIICH